MMTLKALESNLLPIAFTSSPGEFLAGGDGEPQEGAKTGGARHQRRIDDRQGETKMHGTYPYRQALDDPGTRGVDRREFVRICTMVASAAGLGSTAAARFVEAATNGLKPSVIWLHIQECTGCSESLLRASHPAVADRKRRERKAARASRLCRGHSL